MWRIHIVDVQIFLEKINKFSTERTIFINEIYLTKNIYNDRNNED